jgi:hypothetical protein
MSTREFVYRDDNGVHAAFEPDMSDLLDSPAEIIADQFLIGITAARRVVVWHAQEMTRAQAEGGFGIIAEIIRVLNQPCKNRQARDWALSFAFGFARRLNGVRDMSHAARQLNCSRALLSHYKRQWDRLLPPNIRIYGKSPEACKKYRESRNAFLARGKQKQNGKH